MADITISWNGATLVATPSPYDTDTSTGAKTITLAPDSSVESITVSVNTMITPGPQTVTVAYNGPQPTVSPPGTTVYWIDPSGHSAGTAYEYTVSGYVAGVGAHTLDPQIINIGD